MLKKDIERLAELEIEKIKRILHKMVSKDELHISALDYNDEILILRSKIEELSEDGITVIANPDRAEKDGELYQLFDIHAIKMVIFTYNLAENAILDLLEIEEEEEEEAEMDSEYYEE